MGQGPIRRRDWSAERKFPPRVHGRCAGGPPRRLSGAGGSPRRPDGARPGRPRRSVSCPLRLCDREPIAERRRDDRVDGPALRWVAFRSARPGRLQAQEGSAAARRDDDERPALISARVRQEGAERHQQRAEEGDAHGGARPVGARSSACSSSESAEFTAATWRRVLRDRAQLVGQVVLPGAGLGPAASISPTRSPAGRRCSARASAAESPRSARPSGAPGSTPARRSRRRRATRARGRSAPPRLRTDPCRSPARCDRGTAAGARRA